MLHTIHPDVHTHGLADGCPECAALAEAPLHGLDNEMMVNLIELAVDPDRFDKGRSETELVAAAKILTLLEQTGGLFEAAPAPVTRYLRERWHVPLTLTLEGGTA